MNNAISEVITALEESGQTELAEKLRGAAVDKAQQMTKEEIMKIPNTTERQKAIRENLHLWGM